MKRTILVLVAVLCLGSYIFAQDQNNDLGVVVGVTGDIGAGSDGINSNQSKQLPFGSASAAFQVSHLFSIGAKVVYGMSAPRLSNDSVLTTDSSHYYKSFDKRMSGVMGQLSFIQISKYKKDKLGYLGGCRIEGGVMLFQSDVNLLSCPAMGYVVLGGIRYNLFTAYIEVGQTYVYGSVRGLPNGADTFFGIGASVKIPYGSIR